MGLLLAIIDEPPAEVAAAGYDRCFVPIKHGNVDAWLNPESANLAACSDPRKPRPAVLRTPARRLQAA
jgi:hypothetical protein